MSIKDRIYQLNTFRNTLKIFLFFSFLLIVLAFKNGYANQQADKIHLDSVVLQLKWKHQFQFAGYYAAKEKGFYRESGLDVNIIEAEDYSDPVLNVLNGEAHFGIGGSDLIVLRIHGEPVVALAAIFQHSPLVIISKRNAGINNLHDLIGKRVMIEAHSHDVIAYLKDEGITIDRLICYPHVFDPYALLSGEVDAITAYVSDEPYVLNDHGYEYQIFSPASAGIDFYNDILFTTEIQIHHYPERVSSFLEASLRGWEYAFQHSEEIIDLILNNYSKRHCREHLKYEADEIRKLVIPDVIKIGYMYDGRWNHIVRTYAKLDMVSEDVVPSGFMYVKEEIHYERIIYFIAYGVLIVVLLITLVGFCRVCRKIILGIKAKM